MSELYQLNCTSSPSLAWHVYYSLFLMPHPDELFSTAGKLAGNIATLLHNYELDQV